MKLKSLITALSFCLLVACAGTQFSWEDTEKVKNGMTESEVIAILGKPYSRSQSGNNSKLIWSFATAFGGAKAVAYSFENGKIVGQSTVGK